MSKPCEDIGSSVTNHLDQQVGVSLSGWAPPPRPPRARLSGTYCDVVPLDAGLHSSDLYAAFSLDEEGRSWTYLPYGPFSEMGAFGKWLENLLSKDDLIPYAIVPRDTGKAAGIACFLRIDPSNGSIEIGHIHFSDLLKGRIAATEAMFLMMKQVFELGYRRYEWKCDALNAASRSAAARLGFRFEGVFRQAVIYKDRNRDTAWYSIIDEEWPRLSQVFGRWLCRENFDPDGSQRRRLSEMVGSLGEPPG